MHKWAAVLIGSILVLAAGCQPAYVATQPAGSFLIRDVRVFDGEQVLEHRSVVVVEGRIAQIGGPELESKIDSIDGRGRTLVPGLIDAHVHIGDDVEGILGQTIALGVTTVLDMYSGGERLKKLKQVEAEDPSHLSSLLTAGSGVAEPGGHPTQMGGPPLPTLASTDEAQAYVDARIAEGSDYIKIIYDDLEALGFKPVPMLSRESLAAAIEAAHRRGKLAVVHIGTEQHARDAIAAGADGLAHLFLGETVSADFGDFAKRHGVFIVPTLSTLYTVCGKSEGPNLVADPRLSPFLRPEWRERLKMARPGSADRCKATEGAVGQLARAGATVLAGTDSPIPGTAYGASLHGELALLVQNGLTPVQALTAATSATARAFRLADRGLIRPGMRADLVLVEGDPTQDILATRAIVKVWKAGVEAPRQKFE